jgi:hypothetical protein
MNKLTFVTGYTGTCKSHYISDHKSEYDVVLGSPTKFILGVDSHVPSKMIYPVSLSIYYAALYGLKLLNDTIGLNTKNILMERGLWDYVGFHYALSINESETPDYKTLDYEGLHKELTDIVGKRDLECIIFYSNCDRLIEVTRDTHEVGRDNAFNGNGDIEYYKSCQDKFIEVSKYILNRLSIPYSINVINKVDF